jgi:hypothetical protein
VRRPGIEFVRVANIHNLKNKLFIQHEIIVIFHAECVTARDDKKLAPTKFTVSGVGREELTHEELK